MLGQVVTCYVILAMLSLVRPS